MKTTKFSLRLLAFIIFLIVVMMIGTLVFSDLPTRVASAVDTTAVNYDAYTDSDELLGSNYTIRDYASLLHHSTVSWNKEIYNVTADDPIVQIVPKSLFATKGEYLHIGREYGFFVKTTADTFTSQIEPTEIDQYNNNVEVLVFDITTNTDIKNIETPDLITISVEPLFQYRYAYIDFRSDEFYSDGNTNGARSFRLPYSIPDGTNYVVPKPLSMLSEKFDQTWNYFLKDISFSPILLNEQHLNEFDDGYTAFGDDGYFFTQFDYKYDGIVSKVSKKDSIALGLNVASVICGSVSLVPGRVGAIAGVLGLILSGAQTANSIAIVKNNGDPAVGVSISNGEMTAINQFTTKEGQIANYRNQTTGNPRLTKNATFLIEGNDLDGNAWFGKGNHATGYFRVSHTEDWLTRLEREIALSVVDKDGNTYQEGAKSTYKYMINEPMYTSVGLDEMNQLTLLADGDNYFWFMPRYTSDYYFSFDDINSAEVYVSTGSADYTKASIDNDNYYCRMNADNAYKIKIHSANKARLNMTLSPSQSVPNIAPKAEYMIKYSPSATGAYTLAPSNSGFLIKQAYHNSEFNTYDICSNINRTLNCSNVDAVLKSGESYYFVLANNTSAEADSALVATACDKTLKIGINENRRFIGGENYRYYKFELGGSSVNVNFNFSGAAYPNLVTFSAFDANGNVIAPDEEYYDGYLNLGYLSPGIYYIGVRINSTVDLTPQVNTDSIRKVWKQLIGAEWREVLKDQQPLLLERGKKYYFSFWVDKTPIYEYKIFKDKENIGVYKGEVRSSIYINSNAFDWDLVTLAAKKHSYGSDENSLYPEELSIRPIFNVDAELPQLTINYNSKVELNMTIPECIKYMDFVLQYNQYTSSIYSQSHQIIVNDSRFLTFNCLDKLCQTKATKAKLVLQLIKVQSTSNSKTTREIPINREYEINCLEQFYDSSTNSSYISNELHFYNIRNNPRANKVLTTDINLTYFANWDIIAFNSSTIDGQSHTISGMRFSVPTGSNQYYGFVGENRGRIHHLNFTNVAITGKSSDKYGNMRFGTVAVINYGRVDHCNVSGKIDVYRRDGVVGGIVAINNNAAYIEDCVFGHIGNGNQNYLGNSGDIGGIAGRNYNGSVQFCRVLNTTIGGDIDHCSNSYGGVVGYLEGGAIASSTTQGLYITITNGTLISGYYPSIGYIVGHIAGGATVDSCVINGCSNNIKKLTVGYRKNCFKGTGGCYGVCNSGSVYRITVY